MNPGGTAFPTLDEHCQTYGEQINYLRQYYAAKAMQALISTPDFLRGNSLVEGSFLISDAMIKFEKDEAK